ncbi:MAG: serine protease [Acetatifactor sp.]|nr:serine protease [Acetatifactor sp.]
MTGLRKYRNRYQAVSFSACLVCLVCLICLVCDGAGEDRSRPENQHVKITKLKGGMSEGTGSDVVVVLSAGGLQGSGVIWNEGKDGLLILTAAHVLEEAEGAVKVTFAGGWEITATGIQCFEGIDLAAVLIPREMIPKKQTARFYVVRVRKDSFDELKPGDFCVAVGMCGEEGKDSTGKILAPWIYMEDYGQYMLWAEAGIEPGMSGGGLFDIEGNFLGIISGGAEGELAAVPLSLIQGVLEPQDL